MILKEVIRKIEEKYPTEYAMEWDNVGLLLGRTDKEIQRIYIALDVTEEVILHAKEWHADLLLTHHPLIFSPMKRITTEQFIGRRVVELLQSDIAYYAMHTNYDILRMGPLAANMLGIEQAEVLEESPLDAKMGIGMFGVLPASWDVSNCAAHIKRIFHIPEVKVWGDLKQTVKYAAIVPGSGKSCIRTALEKGADVMITGDVDHHEGLDAVAQGMIVIDAGHFGLEHIFIKDMEQALCRMLPETEIQTETIVHPFQII